jgi:hypothetical protein
MICLSMALPAQADLTNGPAITIPPGPVEGVNWPQWIEDDAGNRLELCFDVTCAPLLIQRRLVEAVYYSVDSIILAPGGERFTMSAALTAFPDPLTGAPQISNSVRIRLRNIVTAGQYSVETPFGNFGPFFGDQVIDVDQEVGPATLGLAPDFAGVLTGPIQEFWSNGTGTGNAPGSLFGDGITAAPLQGGGVNSIFRVIGPVDSGIDVSTTAFTVTGRIFIPVVEIIETPNTITRATYDWVPGQNPVVSIFAESDPGATVTAHINGLASPVVLQEDAGGTGKFFLRFVGPRPLPGTVDVTAEAAPLPAKLRNAFISDQITITRAGYTTGPGGKGTLVVNAVSSDKRAFGTRPGLIVFDENGNELGSIDALGQLTVSGMSRPPRSITVRSLRGGEATTLPRIR